MKQQPGFLGRLAQGLSYAMGGSMASANPFFPPTPDGTPRGSRYGRRSALFDQQRQQVNATIMGAGATLRARSRFVCRENGYAANAVRVWVSYSVGTGWWPSFLGLNANTQKAMHAAFKGWSEVCDFDGLTDLCGMQALWAEEEFKAGEVFVWKVPDAQVGLKLRTIQSEQLPYFNSGAVLPGNFMRLGVEFDPAGRRVAYHFYDRNPGDSSYIDAGSTSTVRIPADQILHLFTPTEAGQVRGLPRLTPALVTAYKLDEYDDAVLERANVASKFAGFIKSTLGDLEDPTSGQGTNNGDGSRSFPLEAGVIYELDANEEWQESKPPDPGAAYDDFQRRNLNKMCAAMGVPAPETTLDLKSVNFSAGRLGRQPFQRACMRWGNHQLIPQVLRPATNAWLMLGLLGGTIKLSRGASRDPAAYGNQDWTPPTWEYYDPYKDAQTDALLVDHGFKDRDTVIVERGGLPEETDDKAAAAKKRAEKLDLTFATTIPTGPNKETEPDKNDEGLDENGDPLPGATK